MSLARTAGLTDTGRKRRHNEDSFVLSPPVFAIADGMGGAKAGEVASELAVEALREAGGDGDGDGEGRVVSLIQEANRRVYERALEDAAASGMGTTMTLALLEENAVRIGHVGDSRAYLVRDGELDQLTEDHSLVGELVRSGKLTPEDAESHPQRSVITRVLGTDPDVDIDRITVETRAGDVFLLCSDGLYSMVGNERILELVERHRGDLDAAAKALVRAANRVGGDDNITVVAFEIAGTGEETEQLPAVSPEAGPEEEDTLTEIDRVPAVTTAVMSTEEIRRAAAAERDAEERPSRRIPLGSVFAVLVLLAVVAAIVLLVLLTR